MKLLLTCEHGGNEIPGEYAHLFQNAQPDLHSHKGIDAGALDLFEKLSPLADHTFYATTGRLLVELNRSLHHPRLFSIYTKTLPEKTKRQILERHYLPYRNTLTSTVEKMTTAGEQVLHISVHSFTPELDGTIRNADIGLLYDPARKTEKMICSRWKQILHQLMPELHIRFNYPYQGKADGFTTFLRKKFPENYYGIELEVNQKYTLNNRMEKALKTELFKSVRELKAVFQ